MVALAKAMTTVETKLKKRRKTSTNKNTLCRSQTRRSLSINHTLMLSTRAKTSTNCTNTSPKLLKILRFRWRQIVVLGRTQVKSNKSNLWAHTEVDRDLLKLTQPHPKLKVPTTL